MDSKGPGILLIEDDPLVQEVVQGHLRGRGYEVWIADDAETAHAMMDEHGSSVSLLIVDSGLPVQSGESLAAELKKQFGRARVLMISGYPRKDPHYPFLQKPFSGAQLVSRVEELLKASRE
jgi:two-component system torCAD operon response regulator TorR